MNRYIKQILIFVTVVVLANLWQSRKMPRGEAPVGTVTSMDGTTPIQLPEKSGQIELIYFFAPWCGVCAVSGPNAVTVGRWMPDIKVSFVALDFEQVSEVKEFADANLTGHVYLGNPSVREIWSIEGYPSYALVNSDGKISHRSVGYSTTLGIAFQVLLARAGF